MFAIALFDGIDRTRVEQRTVSLDELLELLTSYEVLDQKRRGRCWSPTLYRAGTTSRSNAGAQAISCMVFDLDRAPPETERLAGLFWIGHTTRSHTAQTPRWRLVFPLATPVPAHQWANAWRRARRALCPNSDATCKDPCRQYFLPSHPAGADFEVVHSVGPLLEIARLPALQPTQHRRRAMRSAKATQKRELTDLDDRRIRAYMARVLATLERTSPGGRNDALNRAAWSLGRWVASGFLDPCEVRDELYNAAERNGLAADDGEYQVWATIRSGLTAGMSQPVHLNGSDQERWRHKTHLRRRAA